MEEGRRGDWYTSTDFSLNTAPRTVGGATRREGGCPASPATRLSMSSGPAVYPKKFFEFKIQIQNPNNFVREHLRKLMAILALTPYPLHCQSLHHCPPNVFSSVTV